MCTGCLSSYPSALLAVSELEIEFEELFDRLVLCAETPKLQREPFSVTVSGETGCLMLFFLLSFQKPL